MADKKKKNSSGPRQNPLKSKAVAILTGAAGTAAILAGGYFLIVAPYFEEKAQAEDQIEALETQQTTLNTQIASMKNYQENISEISEYDTTISAQFPSEAEVNSMRENVYNMAAENGIFVNIDLTPPTVIDQDNESEVTSTEATTDDGTSEEPGTEEGEEPAEGETASPPTEEEAQEATEEEADLGTIAQISITLQVSGDYVNIGNFLDEFYAEYQRGFIIDTFSVSGTANEETGADSYSVAISARTFIYKESISPETLEAEVQEDGEEVDADTEESTDPSNETEEPSTAVTEEPAEN